MGFLPLKDFAVGVMVGAVCQALYDEKGLAMASLEDRVRKFRPCKDYSAWSKHDVLAFARQVAREERERCATTCEKVASEYGWLQKDSANEIALRPYAAWRM